MDVRLYHDSFLQYGGAERTATTWMSSFGKKITCFGADPKLFADKMELIDPVIKKLRKPNSLILLFPLIPICHLLLSKRRDRISEISLVSSSGVAHYFAIRSNLKVLYLNTPTRWIWKREDFEKNRSLLLKIVCRTLRPFYKYIDKKRVRKFDIVIANSKNIQKQISEYYKLDSTVVYPPVFKYIKNATPLSNRTLPQNFFLIVARNRGYKFNDQLTDLVKLIDHPIVICGQGTEVISDTNLIGVGFVSESNLNWLYQNAICLIGLAEEDFGLTPVEAALFGCPTIAFNQGGYVETIIDGINGNLIAKNAINEMAKKLNSISRDRFDRSLIVESATRFSLEKHIAQIRLLTGLDI